jgi:hypothetical protein
MANERTIDLKLEAKLPHSRHVKPEPLLGGAVKPRSPEGGREAAGLRAPPSKGDTRSAVMASRTVWSRLACFLQDRTRGVEAEEQITDRAPQQIRDPSTCEMMWSVVDEMAALAEALEISQPVVLGVMVKMRRGKNDPGLAQMDRLYEVGPARGSATVVAPGLGGAVEPAAIRQAPNDLAVWPAASLANAAGPLESHPPADVGPVARIEPTQFTLDRHRHPISFG